MRDDERGGGRRRQRSNLLFSTLTPSLSLAHFPRHTSTPNSKNSSRRTWKPNVQQKSLWLSAAGKHVRLPVTTTALRTIDKAGGLDSFLLNTKPAKLDPAARALRDWLVGWNAAKTQLFGSGRGGEAAAASPP